VASQSHAGTHASSSHAGTKQKASATHATSAHYRHLAVMAVLSFVAMYGLMYAMVDRAANVFGNLNQFYMAGLMTAAMLLIELAVMREMYENKRLNVIVAGASVVALAALWGFTRGQVAIADEQFLRSMIPHHAGAILMCQQAPIQDPEVRSLCEGIIASQQSEIDQMKDMLQRMNEGVRRTTAD
jgi:uncharacterized protein (DUF305 family)